jgi:hypothetical protein
MALQLVENNPAQYALVDLNDQRTIELIKVGICKGASVEQFQSFMALAKHFRLNPFAKEIYYATTIGVHIGRHGKLRIANRHPDFRGLNSCEIREKDEFIFDAAQNKIVKHLTGKNHGKIIGAWATGKRKGFDDLTVICWLDEYKKSNPAWSGYTQDMIKYKAEDRVLRTLFNSEYEGISMIDPEDERIEELRPALKETISPSPKVITLSDMLSGDDEPETISKAQITRLFTIASGLNLSNAEVKSTLIDKGFIQESSKEILQKDYEYICDYILPELAQKGIEGQQSLGIETPANLDFIN